MKNSGLARAARSTRGAPKTSGDAVAAAIIANGGSPHRLATRNAPKLDAAELKQLLRTMLVIRAFETRTTELFHSGLVKGTAHSSVGQEAVAAGAGYPLLRSDFIATHHRGHGHCIAKGADVSRMMAELLGRKDGICGGLGGSMHVADIGLNIIGANGIVGASMGLGIGAALAAKQRMSTDAGVAIFGDGGANEGIFHEALNMAAIWKLPIVFLCENNQYGLSTSFLESTAGGSVSARAAGYGVPGETIDGNDVVAVYAAVDEAIARARAGEGPTLIEAITYRHGDHSMRANLPGYREDEEVERWKAMDPINRCVSMMMERGALTDDEYEALVAETDAEIERAVEFARNSPEPDLESLAPAVSAPFKSTGVVEPAPGTRELTYLEALKEAMAQEMERDERVFVIGEDVGPIGGTFGVTRGLFQRFGKDRLMNTPISEMGIAGAAVGSAVCGRRPIAEIQIFDFVTFMMDMIVNQAAKLRYMLGGSPTVPVVFRGPQGGGIRLAAQHSQSLEAWFAHVPGLVVVAPSTPYDAKGLLIASIRDDNPVMFLEHKMLYLGQAAPVPETPYEIPLGKADVKREGTDVTVIATQVMVERALQAADMLARENISVEVIDPRTLRPLDMDCFIRSVKKTHRCVVVHEAWRTGGLGGEIAAQINERAFDWLDAPVERLGAMEVPMPYNDKLERAVIPNQNAIADAVRRVCYR
ncbi:alpha-ketoacid dehydrogenase subunit alpha/beta [Mesorhizobium comanense]|jgi:2-oxoisovalerate dehydrogenase E1 component|uniref:alpha-ketoacid dehydrogenase subunit alpha/beta n=1 Tax=Mesorhizobium comanense TaxID=2502215 RepID=UPI001E52E01B|nr:dehydrogenase E1 component subunit alpha/beta [Mesorhizobium comanense]